MKEERAASAESARPEPVREREADPADGSLQEDGGTRGEAAAEETGEAEGDEDDLDPFGYARKRKRRDRGIRWALQGAGAGAAMSALVWLLPQAWRLPFGLLGAAAVLWAFVGSCVWVFSTVPKTKVTTVTEGLDVHSGASAEPWSPVTIDLYDQKESSLDHVMAQVAVMLLVFVGWVFWTAFLVMRATGVQ